MAALEKVVAEYEAALMFTDAWVYLEGQRQLTTETILGARLGLVADPAPGHEQHQGKLAIPYLDKKGRPLTVRFRCVQDHDCRAHGHGKYATLPGDQARIYNVRAWHEAKNTLHITEGELDALTLEQCGFHAVALPGSKAWHSHWRDVLDFNTVKVWGDGDAAGQEMVTKIRQVVMGAQAVAVPRGEDVNSVYVKHGREAIVALERGESID